MKKNVLVLSIIFIIVLMSACTNDSSNQDTKDNPEQNNTQSPNNTISSADDRVKISSVTELVNMSAGIVNAEFVTEKSRSYIIEGEISYDTIIYELKVNNWIKGSGDSKIELTVLDNEDGRISDTYFYDFKDKDNYILFLNYNKEKNTYSLADDFTGVIKVNKDNSISIGETNYLFKECASLDDVMEKIKIQ